MKELLEKWSLESFILHSKTTLAHLGNPPSHDPGGSWVSVWVILILCLLLAYPFNRFIGGGTRGVVESFFGGILPPFIFLAAYISVVICLEGSFEDLHTFFEPEQIIAALAFLAGGFAGFIALVIVTPFCFGNGVLRSIAVFLLLFIVIALILHFVVPFVQEMFLLKLPLHS